MLAGCGMARLEVGVTENVVVGEARFRYGA